METLGFIILRHVNNELTNNFWIHCYNCLRKFYPENKILIIDDSSNYAYVSTIELYNTTIIRSEYPKRGELLPYYYYLRNKLFDTAVIIHDSVFITKYMDFSTQNYNFIWDFKHTWDQIEDETRMINMYNDSELSTFYNDKNLWQGCFGGMCVIKHNYLKLVNEKYDLSKLLECILIRHNRSSFERVIGCLLQKFDKTLPLLGDIHAYCPWGINFGQKDSYTHLPLIKIWCNRQ